MALSRLLRALGRPSHAIVDSGDLKHVEESYQAETYLPVELPIPVDTQGCSGFQDLPEELLEHIFRFLPYPPASRKNYFAVSGVCRSWRALGRHMFFSSPWDSSHLICHPNQLFCLSPRTPTGSRSGLLKCFVRREPPITNKIKDTSTQPQPQPPPGRRFTLWLGKDPKQPQRARFLMCVLQHRRHTYLVYLNSRCEGAPCARITSNFSNTKYTLNLEDDISFLVESAAAATPSSSGSCGVAAATTQGGSAATLASTSSPISNNTTNSTLGALQQEVIATAMPQVLGTLRYRARVRGMMQPRRMEVVLPNPSYLASPTSLPKIQRTTSTASNFAGGSGINSNGSAAQSPARNGSGMLGVASSNSLINSASRRNSADGVALFAPASGGGGSNWRRPCLEQVSAVAVLESPPSTAEDSSFETTTSALQSNNNNNREITAAAAAAAAGGGGAGEASTSAAGAAAVAVTATPLPPTAEAEAAEAADFELQEDNNFVHEDHNLPGQESLLRRAFACVRAFRLRRPVVSQRTAPIDDDSLPVFLRNKSPHWNEAMRCWCLNFRGRVKLASVKNFQLVRESDAAERVVMQFGKVEKDAFILDFNPTVLSAAQAFAICLTTFDGKATL